MTGSLPFTHVAGHQGRTVVGNALFHTRRSFSTDAVPWVTFTHPEVGRVGLTEEQARGHFATEVAVAHQDYEDLDRAVTAGVPYGFAKLVGGPRGDGTGTGGDRGGRSSRPRRPAVLCHADTGGRTQRRRRVRARPAWCSGTSLRLNSGQQEICFKTAPTGLTTPVTGAHIHEAPAGVAGPIVVPLSPAVGEGCVPAPRELIKEIRKNPEDFYVNVHTAGRPAGAIRGQLCRPGRGNY